MKNKRGFTIVELIISIILLILISLFVANRLINTDTTSKNKIYNSKIEIAKNAAYKYGNDHIDELKSDTCTNITIGSLINKKYMEGDSVNKLYLVNPLTNTSMNNVVLCIKYIDGIIEVTINWYKWGVYGLYWKIFELYK